ncbi:MAG: hypothetical protein ACFFG0_03265 [Candidatus Thorarchaeota archaeon]
MTNKYCKRCKKLLPSHNTTNYCRKCYLYNKNKERRLKLRKDGRCPYCSNKVKPKTIIPYRCEKCSERAKDLLKLKNENKHLNS